MGNPEQFPSFEPENQEEDIEKEPSNQEQEIAPVDVEKTPEQEITEKAQEFALKLRLEEKAEQIEEINNSFSREREKQAVLKRVMKPEKLEKQEKSFKEKIRDGFRLTRFALSGIKDRRQMLELVDYLEENIVDDILNHKEEPVQEHYKFNPYHLKFLKKINGLEQNPVEIIDTLKKSGFEILIRNVRDLENLKEIMTVPNAKEKIRILANINAGFSSADIQEIKNIEDWTELIKDESIEKELTPDIQKKIADISVALDEKVEPINFKDYLFIANNQKAFDFICSMGGKEGLWVRERDKNPTYTKDYYDIAHKIKNLCEEGVVDEITTLLDAGVSPNEFSSFLLGDHADRKVSKGFNYQKEKETIEKNRADQARSNLNHHQEIIEQPAMQTFIEQIKDEKFKEFTSNFAILRGEKFGYEKELLKDLSENKNFIPVLYTLKKFESSKKQSIDEIERIADNLNVSIPYGEVLLTGGFQGWADNLQKQLPKELETFPALTLARLYKNKEVQERMASAEGIEIIKILTNSRKDKIFSSSDANNNYSTNFYYFGNPQYFEKTNIFIELLKQPNLLKNLKNLEEYYGYHYSGERDELEHLVSLQRDRKEKLEESINYLKNNPELQVITKKAVWYNSIGALTEPSFLEAINNNREIIDPEIFDKYQDFYCCKKAQKALRKDEKTFSAIYNLQAGGLLEHKQLYYALSNNLENILEKKLIIDPEIINKYQDFYCNPKVTMILWNSPEKFQNIYNLHKTGLLDNKDIYKILANNAEKILAVPEEKRVPYIDILLKINNSPSQEIQKIKNQLLKQLLTEDDPLNSYEKIESIFIKNNLPLVGKIFKIFATLNPQKKIDSTLRDKENASPYLKKSTPRRRMDTIYKDLLQTHIKSANRNLRDYLLILQDGQKILEQAEIKKVENLNEDEQQQLRHFLLKIQTLFANSQLGGDTSPENLNLDNNILDSYQKLRIDIGAKEGQSITQRISDMFLKPMGYKNIEEVLEEMKETKTQAHQRGLNIAQEENLLLKEGDLLKGVDTTYISSILQGGSVAKEYLGAGADSDSTPLDTDVSRVSKEDSEKSFKEAVDNSLSKGYGNLLFAMKDRGQYQITTKENIKEYNPKKLELFNSNSANEKHYGIRTGFPITEIDFMIAQEGLDKKDFEKVCFEIAQNGYYVPITDTNGKIIFTPEQYQELRKNFNGLEKFDGNPFEFSPTTKGALNYAEVNNLSEQKKEDAEKLEILSSEIKQLITEVLGQNDIEMKDDHSTSIMGAELLNTGSTGRNTNLPNDYDFDLTLRLDANDTEKAQKIATELITRLNPEKSDSYTPQGKGAILQLRTFGSKTSSEKLMDIDIGFVKKSELVYFGSHNAVQEKLNWIKDNIGEKAQQEIIANIVLTKKILKENKVYKKQEEGGIGGIGVETWILNNNGNMLNAFQSFIEKAYDKRGKMIPLEKFKEAYKIIDPGMNVQKFRHDNYVENFTDKSYGAMANTLKNYLGGKKIKKNN
ncbi:MAG: hypothetical protein Q7R99_03225 [bacterium]|nr:hypothetical protein [bacterium]